MSDAKALPWFSGQYVSGGAVRIGASNFDDDSMLVTCERPTEAAALGYAADRLEATAAEMRAKAASLRLPVPETKPRREHIATYDGKAACRYMGAISIYRNQVSCPGCEQRRLAAIAEHDAAVARSVE